MCAECARYARQMPSSSVNVRNPARRKAAETLAFALGFKTPKAPITANKIAKPNPGVCPNCARSNLSYSVLLGVIRFSVATGPEQLVEIKQLF